MEELVDDPIETPRCTPAPRQSPVVRLYEKGEAHFREIVESADHPGLIIAALRRLVDSTGLQVCGKPFSTTRARRQGILLDIFHNGWEKAQEKHLNYLEKMSVISTLLFGAAIALLLSPLAVIDEKAADDIWTTHREEFNETYVIIMGAAVIFLFMSTLQLISNIAFVAMYQYSVDDYVYMMEGANFTHPCYADYLTTVGVYFAWTAVPFGVVATHKEPIASTIFFGFWTSIVVYAFCFLWSLWSFNHRVKTQVVGYDALRPERGSPSVDFEGVQKQSHEILDNLAKEYTIPDEATWNQVFSKYEVDTTKYEVDTNNPLPRQ